ncbi:hypothetical protein Leryth_021143 [Lithospermum erythrorhizon]|nr:hypothetical protein Leryth_021143 [Lithospermum erythrorhizon]
MSSLDAKSPTPTAQNPYQEHLNDYHFAKLNDDIKRVTWVIKINQDRKETIASGFGIKLRDSMNVKDDDVVLITCAHILNNKGKRSITVRKIDDKDFALKAEILVIKPTWDLSLLVVKGGNATYAAEFAEDGAISNCETLLHVGHSYNLVYSLFVGRAVYPCVADCAQFSATEVCGDYVSSSLMETPKYRIMGHVWNKTYFDKNNQSQFQFEKNLWAHIPIIQCAGIHCRDGCSGGPMFNTKGHIVGMILGEFDGYQIGTHVALLKEFVRMNSTTNRSSSEDVGRQLKRKEPSK